MVASMSDKTELSRTLAKVYLHVQFHGPILQPAAILTGIIVAKMCLFCMASKNYF